MEHMFKANANKNKYQNNEAEVAAKIYQQELDEEIAKDREHHGKKQIKKRARKEK